MKVFIIILMILVIFIFSVAIGANNDQIVIFNYLVAKIQIRLSTLLACLFGAGFILSWLICSLFYLRLRMKLAILRSRNKKLQQQYDELQASANTSKLLSSTVSSATTKS